MERQYDQILSSARECFQEAEALTPEVNEQLDNMKNLEQNLQAITRTQKEKTGCIETLKKACRSVIDSVYIYLKCCAATLGKALRTVKNESKLPEIMQIKIKNTRRFLETLKKKIDDVAALIEKITTMVEDSSRRGFRMSEKEMGELKITMMKLGTGLKAAENWQKKTEEEWELLNSEITSHLIEAGVIRVVKVAAGTVVAAGAGAAGVALGAPAAIATAAGFPGVSVPGYKVTVGSISALTFVVQTFYHFFSVYGEYKQLRAKCEELRGDREYTTAEEIEKKIAAEGLKETIRDEIKVEDEETGELRAGSLC